MNVIVNMPNRPEGDLIEIPGLGLFENGTSTPVEDDKVQAAIATGLLRVDETLPDQMIFGDIEAELDPPGDHDEAAQNQPVVEEAPVEEPPAEPDLAPTPDSGNAGGEQ